MSGVIDTLVELATRRCDEAAQAVARALAAQRAADDKARMLEQYRAEYVARSAAAARDGTDATSLRNLALFVDKLDAAAAQGAAEAAAGATRVAEAQRDWSEARRTLEGYSALVRRQAGRVALKARRAEQRQQDEFAARSARLQTGGPPE